jgi:hypothetical protein
MKRIAFLMILGVAMIATSCYKDYIPDPPIDQPGPDYCVPPVNVSGGGWTATPTTASIDKAEIIGDYLKFSVSYTANQPRPFDLDWNGEINNGEAAVTLTDYDSPDDPTGNTVNHELCFDLNAMRTADHGEVKLNLAGYKGSDLIYKY